MVHGFFHIKDDLEYCWCERRGKGPAECPTLNMASTWPDPGEWCCCGKCPECQAGDTGRIMARPDGGRGFQ